MGSEGCVVSWDYDPATKLTKISRMPKCVLERVCEGARKSDHYLPISGKGEDERGK
ncbi:MAG: hypothetical protein PHS80_09290 [Methanothrix sp.]|jgi:hypothetical protein|nr:hypothetical protein [Methanothrix sp.]